MSRDDEGQDALARDVLLWSHDETLFETLRAVIARVRPDVTLRLCERFEELAASCEADTLGCAFIDQELITEAYRARIIATRQAYDPLLATCILLGAPGELDTLVDEALALGIEVVLGRDRLLEPLLRFGMERAVRLRARALVARDQAAALASNNARLQVEHEALRGEISRQNEALLQVNATLKAQIAQRDQLAVQLQTADRLASVGLLARGIAHTLNNPLAYVQSNLDMVVEELAVEAPDSAYIQECLDDVLHGVGRIARIVAIIGRLNPAGQHARHLVDVRSTLESLLETIREEIWSRATVELELHNVSPVRAHEPGLAQIILNLILRASRVLKHHCDGRAVLRIMLDERDDHVVLTFEDSGPAPSDEAMRFLFDPFHELEPSAAELYMELPVVYQLVREFEGTIEARRGEPHGMVFEVRLPVGSAAKS